MSTFNCEGSMKIDIIVTYIQRYRFGHERDFVPPITGIHLAALTPKEHDVRVIHQQVDTLHYDSDADLIAVSFFSGFATEAYDIAKKMRAKGKTVIAGGPHATFWQDECLDHFDAIVVGECESVWVNLLNDFKAGSLVSIYKGEPADLTEVPTPRYDLLSDNFIVKRVVQATRGCPYSCSFCTVPSLSPGFRIRPVESVLQDIRYNSFRYWWQRKVVWFWDDNLTINRPYIKELLTEMIPLKKWWLTQASIDIVKDPELLNLLKVSGCIGIFLGIESFDSESLKDANKVQNHINEYKHAVKELHKCGICVMVGIISGFDSDNPDKIVGMADNLLQIGFDVPFLSILTPYKGTKLYDDLQEQDRILKERSWNYYNGYNVAYQPKEMSPDELLNAHRSLWKKAFSLSHCFRRIIKGLFRLRLGAFLMSLCMNCFYGWKRMKGNLPLDMDHYKK